MIATARLARMGCACPERTIRRAIAGAASGEGTRAPGRAHPVLPLYHKTPSGDSSALTRGHLSTPPAERGVEAARRAP